ncbi:hypothetical protein BGZ83_000534 [Gryganskiella cystojenkinii]|nr:hypothetical protein BGZ83_000534 [Gryganskiella cystojenkinii]
MMCLMPSLHEFRTGSVIQDTDILQDQRPWVCLGIKTLKIVFAIDVAQSSRQTARETSQRMILSRLAQFKALEYCQLWDPTVQSQLMVPDTELWISLQDEGGLELLETWKQLRWFTGPVSNVVSWGREEDDWAKENWPRLETIAGVTLWKDARYLRKKQGPLPY